MKSDQSGNALWFILVAIVLLAALTIVLTRSGSSVTQSGDVEQERIAGSVLMRYAKSLESAIDQMKMRGISESLISFEHDNPAVYINAACTVSDCKIFDVSGGGQVYKAPPSNANDGSDWIFTGANNVGTTANPAGTTDPQTGNDLVMLLPNVREELCLQINRDLGITPGTLPEDNSALDVTEFTGAYANALNVIDGSPAPFELDGKRGGCFVATAPNPDVIYFYYVLLAR
jgi:hypothetical protein